jgi:hypothetical protein
VSARTAANNRRRVGKTLWIPTVTAALAVACHPPIRSTLPGSPTPAQIAQLWIEPEPGRDLYWGVGGKRLAPDPAAKYTVLKVDRSGFSDGYDVIGPGKREWSVKFLPEAKTEIVASRIHWGIGFHQPPAYYVAKWDAEDAPAPNPQAPSRFREKKPDLYGLDAVDTWSFFQNPFVGTDQLSGLLVLQAMLGNSDLKDENNTLYELRKPYERASRWYVTRDLGHTFGRTGVISAPRGDLEVFEKTPFIKGIVNGRVKLDWRGRYDTLLDKITPGHVRWVCTLLNKLTDRQWNDAFRAGGYDKSEADRFIRRLKQKIAEGLALKDQPARQQK